LAENPVVQAAAGFLRATAAFSKDSQETAVT